MYVYIIGQSFFIWYMFIYLANLFFCIALIWFMHYREVYLELLSAPLLEWPIVLANLVGGLLN